MNKHGRVIEIRGFRGLLTALFVVCCLVTGFTVFPGFIAMHIWNLFTPYVTDMPQMQLIHGVMLWAICFLIWFAFYGKIPSLHFGCNKPMDEEEIRQFVEKIQQEQMKANEETVKSDNNNEEQE